MEKIIDGKEISSKIKENIAEKVKILFEKYKTKPNLAVVLVGENPASLVYVRNKEKACEKCGIDFTKRYVDENITENELLNIIEELNEDKNINGILVQLPLPKHIDEVKVLNAIDYKKDVDGFHPINVGKMMIGDNSGFLPCTPKGCIELIKSAIGSDLSGKKAIVIGRSNIVGKPVAQLLIRENCTVKIAHSKTKDIENECKWAEIIVVAVGKAKFLKKEMVSNGAVVIDVGTNKTEDGKLCGDSDFDNIVDIVSKITPVPGGVGPMTIAELMENTYKACIKQNTFNL